MKIFAFLGLPMWIWAIIAPVLLLLLIRSIRVHQERYAEAKKLTDEILTLCKQKREGLSKEQVVQFIHYFFGGVELQRRAWADVTATNTNITVWIEYSQLASKEEIVGLIRLEEVLKAAGCKAFLQHLAAEQPEKKKQEEQPA